MNKKFFFSIKKILPRTLFGRSLAILMTPVILIQVVTVFVFFDRHWSKMTSRLAYALAGEISMIVDTFEEGNDPGYLQDFVHNAEEKLSLRVVYENNAPGDNISRSVRSIYVWESMVARTLAYELESALRRPFALDMDFDEKWIQVSIPLDNGIVTISLPGRRLFSSSGYIFLLWMIGTSLLLLVVAILFMRGQIRPIRRLAVAAEQFGKGHEVASFKASGAREVRQAAEAFLGMHRRIKRQMDQRTAMLAGVSHDLRTPLTRLKLQLEMISDSPDADAMKSDIVQMEKMLAGYLDFVRGEGKEAAVFVNLVDFLENIVIRAKRQGVETFLEVVPDINLKIRPLAFERALGNLISNAGKYAKNVWVTAVISENDKFDIFIDDDGPGVAEEEYEDILRPFYRADSSRNAETGGVGLGLPIAVGIVNAHGGRLWLETSPRGGLRVCIRMPA